MKFLVTNSAGRLRDVNQHEVDPYSSILQPTDSVFHSGEIEISSLEELREFQKKCLELSRDNKNLDAWGMWTRGYVPATSIRVSFGNGKDGYDGSIVIMDCVTL
jgi:hypothetical protein